MNGIIPSIVRFRGIVALAACAATFGLRPGHAKAVSSRAVRAVDVVQVQTVAPPDLAGFAHDSTLFRMLSMEPGPALTDSIAAFESRVVYDVNDTLAAIAEDPDTHPLLRANAALMIGRRHDLAHFIILPPLLEARDPRIRLAVVAAAQEFMPILTAETMAVLRRALRDPEDAVQVRALEAITDRDVASLREYVAQGPTPELAEVARGLIRAGEQRGASLVPDAEGVLRKAGPAGGSLVYRPRKVWPDWDMSTGTLVLETPAGDVVVLGESVEVVRYVLPAFFSADGARVVYEDGRSIRVLDVEAARTRTVGPGIAPRPLPFTDRFVFVVPGDRSDTEVRGQTRISYTLHAGSFSAAEGDEAGAIGSLSAVASYDVSGGASPVRWMRVVEQGGSFTLRGDGIEAVPLPDPFGGGR